MIEITCIIAFQKFLVFIKGFDMSFIVLLQSFHFLTNILLFRCSGLASTTRCLPII